jgi:hypothetical protein
VFDWGCVGTQDKRVLLVGKDQRAGREALAPDDAVLRNLPVYALNPPALVPDLDEVDC